MKRLAEEPMDDQIAAQKKTDTLQADLLSSCDDLKALTVITNDCFGDDFCDNISMFIKTTMKNEKARNKVQQMKTWLSDRNVNSDQVSQLPIFLGDSFLSTLNASNTWQNTPKDAGAHLLDPSSPTGPDMDKDEESKQADHLDLTIPEFY